MSDLRVFLNGKDISRFIVSAEPVVVPAHLVPAGEPVHLAVEGARFPGLTIEKTPPAEIDAAVERMLKGARL